MKVLFAQLKFAWKIYFALIFKACDTLTLFHVADRSLEKLVLGGTIVDKARSTRERPVDRDTALESEFDRVALSTNGSVGRRGCERAHDGIPEKSSVVP